MKSLKMQKKWKDKDNSHAFFHNTLSFYLLFFLFLSILVLKGCQSIHYQSPLMKSAQKEEKVGFRMTAGELRMQLNDLATLFSGVIEKTADEIIAQSKDLNIQQHAQLWKINAIPTAYRALFQSDPGVAVIDTWAFTTQMAAYFEKGHGRRDFGQWHTIALDACRRLETRVTELATNTRMDRNIQPTRDKIQDWVGSHPIERDFVSRETTIPVLSSRSGKKALSAFQTVGKLAVSVDDITTHLLLYMNLVTKQVRWQADLMVADAFRKKEVQTGLSSLHEFQSFINRVTPVLERTPDLIAYEREVIIKNLQQEMATALANIDRQRIDTFSRITDERVAATDELKSAQTELMQEVRDLLRETESTGNRIVDNTFHKSEELIDHFFIRLVQFLMVILFLIGLIGAVILFHRKKRMRP